MRAVWWQIMKSLTPLSERILFSGTKEKNAEERILILAFS